MWCAFGYQVARIALVTELPMDSGVVAPLQVTFTPVGCFSGAPSRVIASAEADSSRAIRRA
jgi:hypothetical protein